MSAPSPAASPSSRTQARAGGLMERAGQIRHSYPPGAPCGACRGHTWRLRGTPRSDGRWTFVCAACADRQATAAVASLGWDQGRAEALIGELYRRLNDASTDAPLPLLTFDDRGIGGACDSHDWAALVAAIDVAEADYRAALACHARTV